MQRGLHDFPKTVTSVRRPLLNTFHLPSFFPRKLCYTFCLEELESHRCITASQMRSPSQVSVKRRAGVSVCSTEEQRFIHLIGRRADVRQMDWQECSSKSPLSQLNERMSASPANPTESCLSSEEKLGNTQVKWKVRPKFDQWLKFREGESWTQKEQTTKRKYSLFIRVLCESKDSRCHIVYMKWFEAK